MNIRTKLILTYAGFSFLLLACAGAGVYWKLGIFFEDRMAGNLLQRIDAVALTVSESRTEHPGHLDTLLRRFAAIDRSRITLVRADGTVYLDTDVPESQIVRMDNHGQRPEIRQAVSGPFGKDIRHSATLGRDFLYVARRVDLPQNPRGFVRVSVHLEDLQNMLSDIRWNIAGAASLVLVVMLAVSMFVARRLSKPMVEIARDAEAIRNGDWNRRILVSSHDEVGAVARAVNELVDALNADITKLKKLERVRTEFLGNVSHELRTPLFSLQGYLETLLDGAVDDAAVNRTFLRKSLDHALRLNTLLEDLIEISRIESGEMKMSLRYFRLDEFLESVIEDSRRAAGTKDVALACVSDVEPGIDVFGDKERLRQVMANLLDNAIKYNRPGGSVTVRIMREGEAVRVAVEDTGVGIPAEHLGRIFERFYRVDKDRSREVGGTGLGLAIVKHILEAHQSGVSVASEFGKGSSFSFTLKT